MGNTKNPHRDNNVFFILEVGRLRGWIKTPQEAAEEFDITLEEANEYWKSTYELLPSTLAHLLPQIKAEPTYKIELIENDEIGLYENEVLIYKSNNGAVLGLTEISLEDIPEDVEKNFLNEVHEHTLAQNRASNDSKIELIIEDGNDIVQIGIEPIDTNKKTYQETSIFDFLNDVA